jgi:hypothetical protein
LQKEIRILILFSANDGGRSSMVEPQIVVLVVAGSSPVGHPASQVPKTPNSKLQKSGLGIWNLGFGIYKIVPVAQPDRASDFGSEGWGFESLQARVVLMSISNVISRSAIINHSKQ